MPSTPANSENITGAGLVKFDGTATFTGVTTTQFDVLVGAASNGISNVGPGSAGQVLQSGGNAANPAYSTATYPSTAGTSGNVLTSDGTNFVSSAAPGGGLKVTTIPLNNSQLKALNTTPVQVVAQQGSGVIIIPVSVTYKLVYGGNNAFTNNPTFSLTWGSGGAAAINTQSSGSLFPKETANTYLTSIATNTASTGVFVAVSASSSENAALFVTANANLTGNAANDNTFQVSVLWYPLTI